MGHLSAVGWILDKGVNVNVNVLDRMRCTPLDDAVREGHKVCALLLAERGGLRSTDPGMEGGRSRLVANMQETKVKVETDRVVKAIQETEEVASKAEIDKILEDMEVTTGSLWFNMAMLFNHLWTITKLTFVYNSEAGYEHLKVEGYGNVPPEELEGQIQETRDIIKKLMDENVQSAIETLAKFLSDPVVKRAEKDHRLALLGAGALRDLIKMGKVKLALLTTLVSDLKEECEVNNYFLTRLVREVKREINVRVANKKQVRAKTWKKASTMVGILGALKSTKQLTPFDTAKQLMPFDTV
jgi:hypothetical protein